MEISLVAVREFIYLNSSMGAHEAVDNEKKPTTTTEWVKSKLATLDSLPTVGTIRESMTSSTTNQHNGTPYLLSCFGGFSSSRNSANHPIFLSPLARILWAKILIRKPKNTKNPIQAKAVHILIPLLTKHAVTLDQLRFSERQFHFTHRKDLFVLVGRLGSMGLYRNRILKANFSNFLCVLFFAFYFFLCILPHFPITQRISRDRCR